MKKQTIYQFIVDRSGSMSDCVENTVSGFNEQVNRVKMIEQEFPDQNVVMGLTSFNHDVVHHLHQVPAAKMPYFSTDMYRPEGTTALLDAIGLTVKLLETEVNKMQDTTCVVIIITDGHENASKYYSLPEVRGLISRLEETGKWTFSFIGATLDAVDVAAQMNINRANAYSFDKKDMKSAVWNKLSRSMKDYAHKKHSGETDLSQFISE